MTGTRPSDVETLPEGVATYRDDNGDERFTFTGQCPTWCPVGAHDDIMIEDLAHWGGVCGELMLSVDKNDEPREPSILRLTIDQRPERPREIWLNVNDALQVAFTLPEATRLVAILTATIEAAAE